MYIVLINGEVATVVSGLSKDDMARLNSFIERKGALNRVQIVSADVVTSVFAAEAEIEQALDLWRP